MPIERVKAEPKANGPLEIIMDGDELQVLYDEIKTLRRLLWLRHGCVGLYGDDGEMQCGSCLLDFKRDSIEQINNVFEAQALQAYTDYYRKEQRGGV